MSIILDKLIKRTSLKYITDLLKTKTDWKILDVGCGYSANPLANVICDVIDLSSFYKDKKFIKLNDQNLPFKDKEFDFVISSHVIEHVDDVTLFISELERVSKRGYIELPTKLEDNLVFENKKEHKHHMEYNDVKQKLIIKQKIQFFEPILTVSSIKKFNDIFRESLVIELFWEDKIDYEIENKNIDYKKISIFNLIKKYISKKIRMLFN